MFILENYLSNRKQKIANWETAKAKWLNQVGYRYESQWNREHPYPTIKLGEYIPYVGAVILASIFVFFVINVIISSAETDKKEMNATKEGMTCRMFNKNDHVNIQNGDYENTKGTIVGGCNNGEDYQVKIDDNQKVDLPADGLDAVDVGGKIIPIDSYKHIVVIEK